MGLPTRIIAKHAVAAQIVFVGLSSAALTYATIELNYRTVLNAAWMIVLPLVIGLSANQGAGRKALMGAALMGVSLLAVMTVGWAMGGI